MHYNSWITIGIKSSCKWKRKFYIASRNSNNLIIKKHYQTYCKILADVTKETKGLYYNLITNSPNKIKTTWMIVNLETHRKAGNGAIESLHIDCRIINNQQHIADTFNSYFLSIIDISINKNNTHTQNKYNPNPNNNNSPFQSISQINNSAYTKSKRISTTSEMEKIIRSLKSKDSHGYNEISTTLLRISSSFISSHLNNICSEVVTKGIIPDKLTFSIIMPLYKKGNE